jgi:hypothetical protein
MAKLAVIQVQPKLGDKEHNLHIVEVFDVGLLKEGKVFYIFIQATRALLYSTLDPL